MLPSEVRLVDFQFALEVGCVSQTPALLLRRGPGKKCTIMNLSALQGNLTTVYIHGSATFWLNVFGYSCNLMLAALTPPVHTYYIVKNADVKFTS